MRSKMRIRFLENRLTPVIIVFGLVMVGFGLLLFMRMDTILKAYEEAYVRDHALDAARLYASKLDAEIEKLSVIARVMEGSDKLDEKASLETASMFIEKNYADKSDEFVGLLSSDCKAVFGEKLSPSDYKGIMNSLHGYGGISYTPSGGVLFSYPIKRNNNVRYVLYELRSSQNFSRKFPPIILDKIENVCLMTRVGDMIIPFSIRTKADDAFYNSLSVNRLLRDMIPSMELKSFSVVLKDTVNGEKYFFTSEVTGTDFIIAGCMDRMEISYGLVGVPRLVLLVFFLLVIMVMSLAFFLMVASQRLREGEALQRAKAAAEEASRAKSDFLANMSHEIRTPINTILGMDEIILREYRDPTLRKYAFNIQSSGRILLSLINDVLDFSKIEAGKMELYQEEYDLTVLVMDLVGMMRQRAVEKGLSMEIDVDENTPHLLYGDQVRILQVILNLLSNAVKYTKEGSVSLAVHYRIIDEKEIYLDVAVKDTGIGIRQEDIKELFSAFKRIDEVRNRTIEGTGLGMNIVWNLLNLMDSKLKVDSVYGEGSCFSFSVKQGVRDWEPIGSLEAAFQNAAEIEKMHHTPFTAPDAKVLLVDDTEMNLMVVKGLLKDTKIQIDTAPDGKQALSLAEERDYDLLLIDHRMPVMDGVEMLSKLRQSENSPNRSKPCIVLTANAVAGAREEYLSKGFDDYLVKPVDSQHLEHTLLKYLPGEKIHFDQTEEAEAPFVSEDMEDDDLSASDTDFLNKFEEKGFLDVREGIEYSGSADMYIQVLKVFAGSIDAKIDEIRTLYNQCEWKDYTTKVHALKSSARVIGATELSNKARALELAAIDNDMVYIREHTGGVLAFYGSYKEKLKGILKEEEE